MDHFVLGVLQAIRKGCRPVAVNFPCALDSLGCPRKRPLGQDCCKIVRSSGVIVPGGESQELYRQCGV